MDTDILETFLIVAQVKSLTKAAALLATAPSSISRHIASFETECSARLFRRTGRGMELTDLGESLRPLVYRALEGIDAIRTAAHVGTDSPTGDVKIGLLPIVATAITSRLFKEIKSHFPSIRISIVEGYSTDLEAWLADGKLDLAISLSAGLELARNKEGLARVDACLVSAPGNPHTARTTIDFDELVHVPLVLATSPNPLRTIISKICDDRGLSLQPMVQANSFAVELQLIETADVCSITPYFAVAKQVEAGKLQTSLVMNPRIERWLTLEMASHRPSPLAVRQVSRVIEAIIQELQEANGWTRPPK